MKQELIVDFHEIRAVRWTCPACHTGLDFPISDLEMFSKAFRDSPGIECQVCGRHVGVDGEHNPATAARAIRDAIRIAKENDVGFTLVLNAPVS